MKYKKRKKSHPVVLEIALSQKKAERLMRRLEKEYSFSYSNMGIRPSSWKKIKIF